MKYVAISLLLLPALGSAGCLFPEDVESFLEQLDRSHFAGLDTHVDVSDPRFLRYRFSVEEGVTGSFVWCWRTGTTEDNTELECLSGGTLGIYTDPNESEDPETFLDEEPMIHESFEAVANDYLAFLAEHDMRSQTVELTPAPAPYCDMWPASDNSQQEERG